MRKQRLILTLAFTSVLLHACGGGGGGGAQQLIATHFMVTAPASAPAGTSFNVTVTALDASNKTVTNYAGTIVFTSTDTHAVLPNASTLNHGSGTFSVTLKTAGGQAISVTDTVTSSIVGNASISVNAGPASQLSVVALSGVASAGIAISFNVTALDAYGNTATSYKSTDNLSSSDPNASFQPSSSLMVAGGVGAAGVTFQTSGNQTITAVDGVTSSIKGTSGLINVVTNAVTHLAVNVPGSANTRTTFNFSLTALDAAGNMAMGYSGTVQLSSSDPSARLPASTTLMNGISTALAATLETTGTQTIKASDTKTTSITGSASIAVSATPALVVSSGPPNGTVGNTYVPRTITVRHCTFIVFPDICVNPTYRNVFVSGFPLQGGGGVPPYSWAWSPVGGSSLPQGLGVSGCVVRGADYPKDDATCILGVPTQPGTYQVALTISDSGLPSMSTTTDYTITIVQPSPPAVNTTPPPPPGVVNQPYSYTFTASGYPPLGWSESGALPNGLAFNGATGVLSGTPTAANTFPFAVTATDQFEQSSPSADFTIVISAHGFQATGSMTTARTLHTATLLTGGKVLVTGGQTDATDLLASAELFDPSSGTFTTTGNMQSARSQHTATLLNDGRVLLAGGSSGAQGAAVATAELYDSAGATSTATAGNLQAARFQHTATLLNDGTVLLIGGADPTGTALASAEIFDPTKGTFTTTGSMESARKAHTATLLANGMVLVTGGMDANSKNLDTAELYDPTSGAFTAVSGMMTVTRSNHTATLFTTGADAGKVLVAGGLDDTGTPRNTAELFDPNSETFTATTNMGDAHANHTATLLNDGTLLIAGGLDASGPTASVEVFDPSTTNFATTGSFVTPRTQHTATVLVNGNVLATGGSNGNGSLQSAEVYQ